MVKQICTALDENTYNYILDEASKRNVSKSKALSQIVSEYRSNGHYTDNNDKVMRDNENKLLSLTLEIDLKDKLITQLQSENGFLKQEYAKATEALNRFLLPPPQPKRGLIDRILRRNKTNVG